MQAAAHTPGGFGGVPQEVGAEFVAHDSAPPYETELDAAEAVRDGTAPSPLQYENVSLFKVRITGTGTSYRSAHDEFVYRPPEHFLTEKFVQRCNGLPLIFEHPESSVLDSEEFRQRAIGTIILPYIDGDEVWGVAKVFDADGAALMQSSHASTSPAVVFRNAGSTEAVEIDGQTLLIEGTPSYLDHLAICENGVWDKGGAPSGIAITPTDEEPLMDKEQEQAMPAWADAIMKRLDAIEAEKAADSQDKPEELKAKADESGEADEGKAAELKPEDEARKEDEKLKEAREMEYADAIKRNEAMKAEIDSMNRKIEAMSRPLSNDDRDALASAQKRADGVYRAFGDSASAPLAGETPIAYRKRLAAKLQMHSKSFKDAALAPLEGPAFDAIESIIYADALAAAKSPMTANSGRLFPISYTDSAGRNITKFEGDIGAAFSHFMAQGAVAKINRVHK